MAEVALVGRAIPASLGRDILWGWNVIVVIGTCDHARRIGNDVLPIELAYDAIDGVPVDARRASSCLEMLNESGTRYEDLAAALEKEWA